MTLFDLIKKLTQSSVDLEALLNALKPISPALQPQIDNALAQLSQSISDANLLAVVQALPGEAANIIKGDLDPKDHPSDAI